MRCIEKLSDVIKLNNSVTSILADDQVIHHIPQRGDNVKGSFTKHNTQANKPQDKHGSFAPNTGLVPLKDKYEFSEYQEKLYCHEKVDPEANQVGDEKCHPFELVAEVLVPHRLKLALIQFFFFAVGVDAPVQIDNPNDLKQV